MDWAGASAIGWLFDGRRGASDRLIPRWLFLRTLGIIYFSAFFSLIFQIRGLVGPAGILPAGSYLAQSLGHWQRWWYAPTVLWFSSGSATLSALCWAGMIASALLVLNLWPRGMLVIGFVCFLSFVSAAQDFSGYQSDGMLLAAERGPRVAALHCYGRVLPERAPAHMDRLVCATLAALVPCQHSLCHAGSGTGSGVDVLAAATLADYLLLYCYALADRRNPDGQLHISELSRSGDGCAAAG